ncbi:MAG TPA: LysR substrate-binding domain-containing protein [Thermodesulfobacteriota bacterium]
MSIDLTDLRLFLEVTEAGSITHGAGRAGLSLAAASARIRGMEASLGVALLERGSRGVRTTPAGQALARHARTLLEQVERMRGEIGEYARGLKGRVRLLANTAAVAEFLPGALARYLAAHPDVDVQLEERPSREIARAVAEGIADAGVAADSVDLTGLETFPFRADRLVVVAAPAHPLAAGPPRAFREVLDHDVVGLGTGSALQAYLDAQAASAGRPLKVRVRVRGFDAVCRMAERGVGVAIVPEVAARRYRRSMRIRVVRLTDPWAVRRLTICVRRFDALPGHARRLIEFLAS